MARRRGFLAEVQHQAKVANHRAEQAQRAQARQQATAARETERARRVEERARAQLARAAEADRKRLEKEARDAHVAAMQAEVEERNANLAVVNEELDSLLQATLEVDDFVDLETLRRTAQHPPFEHASLEVPIPYPPPIAEPPQPVFVEPDAPSGLFGKKKKQEQAREAATAEYQAALAAYQAEMAALPGRRQAAAEFHAEQERQRTSRLELEREAYRKQCADREAEVSAQNAELDSLIANLGYGVTEAVEEYVGIILSNSVYPESFPVDHDYTFDPSTAELSLRCLVPGPTDLPSVKAYKYTKSTDEITESALSAKASKDRYASCVHQVALRSLHEVFEADRRGVIKSIQLELGTETIDPATGVPTYVPFVSAAAERDSFMSFDLSAVVPAATLQHLGASMSKNPSGLVPAEVSGVRRA